MDGVLGTSPRVTREVDAPEEKVAFSVWNPANSTSAGTRGRSKPSLPEAERGRRCPLGSACRRGPPPGEARRAKPPDSSSPTSYR